MVRTLAGSPSRGEGLRRASFVPRPVGNPVGPGARSTHVVMASAQYRADVLTVLLNDLGECLHGCTPDVVMSGHKAGAR